jgi:hypothetical protein
MHLPQWHNRRTCGASKKSHLTRNDATVRRYTWALCWERGWEARGSGAAGVVGVDTADGRFLQSQPARGG